MQDRFQLIAGERRLRAVKYNGQNAIPALLMKIDSNQLLLTQLAENIQRENLTLDEECEAIALLYEILGSLDKVSNTVKKSKPWCSKRYAMTQDKLNWAAKKLLEDGVTENIELLKALSSLYEYLRYNEYMEWVEKVKVGEAGRNEIRGVHKAAKSAAKQEKEETTAMSQGKIELVSHAKSKEPPAPPKWNVEWALGQLEKALNDPEAEQGGIALFRSWTPEQQGEIDAYLGAEATKGETINLRGIRELGRQSFFGSMQIESLAKIYGYAEKSWYLIGFLEQLQITREND